MSVKDPEFGATGNSTTDDTSAIQSAIDWIASIGGGTVYFPPGRYRVDSTIQVPSGIQLVGCGGARRGSSWAGVSQLFAGGSFSGAVIRNASPLGNHSILIKALQVTGAPSVVTNEPAVIFTAEPGAKNIGIIIEDCMITQGGAASVELHRTGLSQIRNCRIGGDGPCAGSGIRISLSADNQVFGNQVTTGCTYESPNQGGVGIEVRGAANMIEGNMVFWSRRGIDFYDPLQTIVGNRIEMNMGSGIYTTAGSGATITGNTIFLNGAGGPSYDIGAGIELATSARGMAMTGNLIANWNAWTQQQHKQRYGIVYRGGSAAGNNVDSGNVFKDLVIADTHTIP